MSGGLSLIPPSSSLLKLFLTVTGPTNEVALCLSPLLSSSLSLSLSPLFSLFVSHQSISSFCIIVFDSLLRSISIPRPKQSLYFMNLLIFASIPHSRSAHTHTHIMMSRTSFSLSPDTNRYLIRTVYPEYLIIHLYINVNFH